MKEAVFLLFILPILFCLIGCGGDVSNLHSEGQALATANTESGTIEAEVAPSPKIIGLETEPETPGQFELDTEMGADNEGAAPEVTAEVDQAGSPEVDPVEGPGVSTEVASLVCRKGDQEEVYIVFKPGRINSANLCEVDLFINGNSENPADWRATKSADWCVNHFLKNEKNGVKKVKENEGYNCVLSEDN